MSYIETVPAEQASGLLSELYDADMKANGFIANYTRAFSLRPEVNQAWRSLIGSIRGNMDPRRYELVTLAAAARLRCSYCMVAHGAILRSKFFSPEEVEAIAHDYRSAGLSDVDVAIMAFAEKVTQNAYKVMEEDIENLRSLGLSDAEVLDVVLATSARNFFSKVLDGTGAQPDQETYDSLEPNLREALMVGRPIG
ncbi:MAG: peroxidase-related enzyme [Chloroflexota bacterium]